MANFKNKMLSVLFSVASAFGMSDATAAPKVDPNAYKPPTPTFDKDHIQREAYVVMRQSPIIDKFYNEFSKDGTGQTKPATEHTVMTENSNAFETIYPASTTKIMTSYLLLQLVKDGTLNLKSQITGTNQYLEGRQIGVYGKKFTVNEALEMMLIHSSNDVAHSVAESVAEVLTGKRDQKVFVDMMNEKAVEFGMYGTHFRNPSGLDDPEHYSTAADMAYLAYRFVKDNPEVFDGLNGKNDIPDYTSGMGFTWGGESHFNTNTLVNIKGQMRTLGGVPFKVDGLKTGFLELAGRCLLATAKFTNPATGEEQRVFVSYFGGKDIWTRHARVQNLLAKEIDNVVKGVRSPSEDIKITRTENPVPMAEAQPNPVANAIRHLDRVIKPFL